MQQSNWQPMETCPEGRPVFVRTKMSPIYIATRTDRDSVRYEDGSFGRINNLTGWHSISSEWRTDKAPRTGEWLLVTWRGGNEKLRGSVCRLYWKENCRNWIQDNGAIVREDWLAWMHAPPEFIPPPKPAKPVDDLAGKSVDEIVSEIKRLTDHLAAALKTE